MSTTMVATPSDGLSSNGLPSNDLSVESECNGHEARHPILLTFSAADEGGISRLTEAFRQFF